jgi:mannose-6-phosphate isomerase-like protein (cupin superfamily)
MQYFSARLRSLSGTGRGHRQNTGHAWKKNGPGVQCRHPVEVKKQFLVYQSKENQMRNLVLSLGILVGLSAAAAFGQNTSGAPPQMAFDITKADIDTLLKNAPPAVDQQLRVVDMGKYNLGVGIIHRGPTNDKPGDPISGPYHDQTAETYIILSGSGILTTGGTTDKKPSPNYNILNGPGGNATAGTGSYSRKVQAGDIILIPPGVLHAWSQITDQVTYLSVRPDPDRVLPAGYVNPLLMKNLPTAVPPAK